MPTASFAWLVNQTLSRSRHRQRRTTPKKAGFAAKLAGLGSRIVQRHAFLTGIVRI
jgi:hypothetical protein